MTQTAAVHVTAAALTAVDQSPRRIAAPPTAMHNALNVAEA